MKFEIATVIFNNNLFWYSINLDIKKALKQFQTICCLYTRFEGVIHVG